MRILYERLRSRRRRGCRVERAVARAVLVSFAPSLTAPSSSPLSAHGTLACAAPRDLSLTALDHQRLRSILRRAHHGGSPRLDGFCASYCLWRECGHGQLPLTPSGGATTSSCSWYVRGQGSTEQLRAHAAVRARSCVRLVSRISAPSSPFLPFLPAQSLTPGNERRPDHAVRGAWRLSRSRLPRPGGQTTRGEGSSRLVRLRSRGPVCACSRSR